MNENGNIEFECVKPGCNATVEFSLRQVEKDQKIQCASCQNVYHFDQVLVSKLVLLENLVAAVKNAREILGNTAVGVTVDQQTVTIPYRLLLTRMTTMLTLEIGGQQMVFRFRVEPLREDEIKAIQ